MDGIILALYNSAGPARLTTRRPLPQFISLPARATAAWDNPEHVGKGNIGRVEGCNLLSRVRRGHCARLWGSAQAPTSERTTEATISLINASASGQFKIGSITINRLGYGAMRITGPGVWGPPSDRKAALATLRRLPEIGVNFIDTADSYGPDVSEELIREALHPYKGLLIATKAGLTRQGPSEWTSNERPTYLIAQAKGSLRKLGVEQIDLWQLHRIDPRVPRDEQFGAIRQLLDEGIIRNAGLSEVSVPEIEAARRIFPVATVQNHYGVADRRSGRESLIFDPPTFC